LEISVSGSLGWVVIGILNTCRVLGGQSPLFEDGRKIHNMQTLTLSRRTPRVDGCDLRRERLMSGDPTRSVFTSEYVEEPCKLTGLKEAPKQPTGLILSSPVALHCSSSEPVSNPPIVCGGLLDCSNLDLALN
jgi:hypothetical protein